MSERPGRKQVERVINGRTTVLNVKDTGDVDPTHAELEAELAGAVSLGVKELTLPGGSSGQTRGVVKFELFVDLRSHNRTWRRYEDGRIERGFSMDPAPAPEHLGSIARRPHEPQMFPPAPKPEPQEPVVNPFAGLPPELREAIEAAAGLRR